MNLREWWRDARKLPVLAQHVRVLARKSRIAERWQEQTTNCLDQHARLLKAAERTHQEQLARLAQLTGELLARCEILEAQVFDQVKPAPETHVIH